MSEPVTWRAAPPIGEPNGHGYLVAAAREWRCECVWRGQQCRNLATQEDGLCNWCGNGRTPEQMMDDPKALISPDGEFFGIGGAGQLHDGTPAAPGACWYPDSGRTTRSEAEGGAS